MMSKGQYKCPKFDILIISDFGQNEYEIFKDRIKDGHAK